MTKVTIVNARVENYLGLAPERYFHACFCDAPYHLTALHQRFNKPNSKPTGYGKDGAFNRLSKGFMGQTWDGGQIAFDPDLWKAIGRHLYAGGFALCFGASSRWHRLACAMEDSGLVIQPSIFDYHSEITLPMMFGWGQAQGFPKATRLQRGTEKEQAIFEGHRYGQQSLKPAIEPLILAQNPFPKAIGAASALRTGAGLLNVDAARIEAAQMWAKLDPVASSPHGTVYKAGRQRIPQAGNPLGRWPPNWLLTHLPGCEYLGEKRVKAHAPADSRGRAHGFGPKRQSVRDDVWVAGDAEGMESVAEWRCAPDCPVRALIAQGGESAARYFFQAGWALDEAEAPFWASVFARLATADPVRYTPKASQAERDAGVGNAAAFFAKYGVDQRKPDVMKYLAEPQNNPHPTIKPLSLNLWLAALLAPPARYAPRRLVIPFSGVGSELIAALLSGEWEEIVGIEQDPLYCAIAEARVAFWQNLMTRTGLRDPKALLSAAKKFEREETYFRQWLGEHAEAVQSLDSHWQRLAAAQATFEAALTTYTQTEQSGASLRSAQAQVQAARAGLETEKQQLAVTEARLRGEARTAKRRAAQAQRKAAQCGGCKGHGLVFRKGGAPAPYPAQMRYWSEKRREAWRKSTRRCAACKGTGETPGMTTQAAA